MIFKCKLELLNRKNLCIIDTVSINMFFLQFTEIFSSLYPHFRILCCQLLPIKSQDIHFLEKKFYSLWPLGPLFIGESNIGRAQRFMSI